MHLKCPQNEASYSSNNIQRSFRSSALCLFACIEDEHFHVYNEFIKTFKFNLLCRDGVSDGPCAGVTSPCTLLLTSGSACNAKQGGGINISAAEVCFGVL